MTCQLLVPLPLLLKYKLIILYFQCTWSSARMFFIFSLHTFLSPSLSLNLFPFAPSLSSPPHILPLLPLPPSSLTFLAYLRTVAVTCGPMPASWVTSSMRTPMAASCGSSTTVTSSWWGQGTPTLSGTQPRWRKETTLWNCRCVRMSSCSVIRTLVFLGRQGLQLTNCTMPDQIYPILWSNVAFLVKMPLIFYFDKIFENCHSLKFRSSKKLALYVIEFPNLLSKPCTYRTCNVL